MSVTIRQLTTLDEADLNRLIVGYTSESVYVVRWTETDTLTHFSLELQALPTPAVVRYGHLDAETLAEYQTMLQHGLSFGAFEKDEMVGIALCTPENWNGALWVREFHIAETHQRKGIGRSLMDTVAEKGRNAGLRVIVCETQNTNVPAIHFYRGIGFRLEGVDLSYYTNSDWPDKQVAVFMKRRL